MRTPKLSQVSDNIAFRAHISINTVQYRLQDSVSSDPVHHALAFTDRSDMSTSQGGSSNDSLINISNCLEAGLRHRKIANSLQAGLLGHAAFLDSQERDVVVPMSRVLQRHYVRRSVPSKNVLESEEDTEGMSEDENLRRSKRITRG